MPDPTVPLLMNHVEQPITEQDLLMHMKELPPVAGEFQPPDAWAPTEGFLDEYRAPIDFGVKGGVVYSRRDGSRGAPKSRFMDKYSSHCLSL